MHGSISVVGWKAASEVAIHLIDAGYEVLITSDGERVHQIDSKGELHLAYTVAFAHPKFEGTYFELVEEPETLRSWKDIKQELKLGEADIAEGLDHLTESAVWVTKKKKGKK